MEVGGIVTHQDEGVGFPVGRGDLIRQPGGDGLGGLHAELRHRLSHQVDPVQKALRCVAVVLQEAVRLRGKRRPPGCFFTALEPLNYG